MTEGVIYPTAEVQSFRLGLFVSYDDCGDAWVEAPDGSVGTLIPETVEPVQFEQTIAPTRRVAGVAHSVRLPLPLTTDVGAARYLEALLPELPARWEQWKVSR